jgi:hypothetical protein
MGFGLPEIMISLFLSSFIMISLINYYLGAKKEYLYLRDRLEREYDLMNIVDNMRNSIRQAGFTPCGPINQLTTFDTRNGNTHLQSIIVGNPEHSSLIINRMSEQFATKIKISAANEITILDTIWKKFPQELLIADCFHAEVNTVESIRNSPEGKHIILKNPLHYSYNEDATVGELLEEQFYINKPTSSLYFRFHHADELTAVIHTMEIQATHVQERELLTIVLGLNDEKTLQFTTLVRE